MLNMKKGGRGNRKRNMIPGFLLVFLFVFTMSFSAMAAQEDKYSWLAVLTATVRSFPW